MEDDAPRFNSAPDGDDLALQENLVNGQMETAGYASVGVGLDSFIGGITQVANVIGQAKSSWGGQWAQLGSSQGQLNIAQDVAHSGGYRTGRYYTGRKRARIDSGDSGDGGGGPPAPPAASGGMNPSSGPLTSLRYGCPCPMGTSALKVNEYVNEGTLNGSGTVVNLATPTILQYAVFPLNPITQGSDYDQRIGRLINMKWMNCRFFISATANDITNSSNQGGCFVRVSLFYDRQTNGTSTNIGDLFSFVNGVLYITNSYNYNSRYRYIPLYDNVFALQSQNRKGTSSQTGLLTPDSVKYLRCDIPLKNLRQIYSGSAGNLASITTGAIICSVQLTNGNHNLNYHVNARLVYSDE